MTNFWPMTIQYDPKTNNDDQMMLQILGY